MGDFEDMQSQLVAQGAEIMGLKQRLDRLRDELIVEKASHNETRQALGKSEIERHRSQQRLAETLAKKPAGQLIKKNIVLEDKLAATNDLLRSEKSERIKAEAERDAARAHPDCGRCGLITAMEDADKESKKKLKGMEERLDKAMDDFHHRIQFHIGNFHDERCDACPIMRSELSGMPKCDMADDGSCWFEELVRMADAHEKLLRGDEP